jgi:hypothetical protein
MERRTSNPKLQIEAPKIAEGYFGSQLLCATNSLGVFERLASSSLSLAERPVMHSLLLLLIKHARRAYSVGETLELIRTVGFTNGTHKRMSMLNVNSLILADKPLSM